MGRKGKNRGRGPGQPPIKGFRPGKEPAHLRKQRAKAQLGGDANWAQKKMIDTLGDKTPQEVQTMLKRWVIALLVLGSVLAVLGAFLYAWSIVAGILVHLLAALAFFVFFRLRRQRTQLVEMTRTLGGGGRRR